MENIHTSVFTAEEIEAGVGNAIATARNIYNGIRLGVCVGSEFTVSETDNAEWTDVLLDADDRVLAGIKADGSLFVGDMK